MHASQMYDDDVDAVIMAAEENPEYQEEIVESFIDQVMRRSKKRRSVAWRNGILLLLVGIFGTLFIDRLISFPLSLFAFIFLWLVVFGSWAITRFITLVKRNAMRLALTWLLTRAVVRRTVAQSMRGSFSVSLVKTFLRQLVKRFLVVTP